MAVITCDAKFASDKHKCYKYINYKDAPGCLHHQLIPRITRGCIYIKGVNNKKFNHASSRQLVDPFHSYWRSSVPSIPAEQLIRTCRCPFHRAAMHDCKHLWSEVWITQT